MVSGLTSAMQSKGADHYTATQQAMHIMDNLIGRQASVLAYNHVFLLVTSLFVIGLPLVLLLRRGAPSAEAEVMVE
jgi:hypothetical protein